MFGDTFVYASIVVYPEAIIQNQIPFFSINFFNSASENDGSIVYILRNTVSQVYVTIRNICLVAMLIVLVYMAIRAVIELSPREKSRYKEGFVNCLVGVILIIGMHYIMSISVSVIESISSSITTSTVVGTYSSEEEATAAANEIIENDSDSLTVAGGSITITGYEIYEALKDVSVVTTENVANFPKIQEALGKFGLADDDNFVTTIATSSFMEQARYYAQQIYNVDDDGNTYDTWVYIGWSFVYIMFVILTFALVWLYGKRVLYMALLMVFAPIVGVMYPINRARGGRAQSLGIWFREFFGVLIMQPIHLVIYMVLIGSAMSMAVNNPVYALVAMMALVFAEGLLKELLGIRDTKIGGLGQAIQDTNRTIKLATRTATSAVRTGIGVASSAVGGAMNIAQTSLSLNDTVKANKLRTNPNAGVNALGQQNANGQKSNNNQNSANPSLDSNAETNAGLPAGSENDENKQLDADATLKKYHSEGFKQNANGEYFNPWTGEYDANYNPLKDSSFQVFKDAPMANASANQLNPGKVLNADATMQNYFNEGFRQNADGQFYNPWTGEYDPDYNPLNDTSFQKFDSVQGTKEGEQLGQTQGKQANLGQGINGEMLPDNAESSLDGHGVDKTAPNIPGDNDLNGNALNGDNDNNNVVRFPTWMNDDTKEALLEQREGEQDNLQLGDAYLQKNGMEARKTSDPKVDYIGPTTGNAAEMEQAVGSTLGGATSVPKLSVMDGGNAQASLGTDGLDATQLEKGNIPNASAQAKVGTSQALKGDDISLGNIETSGEPISFEAAKAAKENGGKLTAESAGTITAGVEAEISDKSAPINFETAKAVKENGTTVNGLNVETLDAVNSVGNMQTMTGTTTRTETQGTTQGITSETTQLNTETLNAVNHIESAQRQGTTTTTGGETQGTIQTATGATSRTETRGTTQGITSETTQLNTETLNAVNNVEHAQTQGATTRTEVQGTTQATAGMNAGETQRTTVQGNTTQGSSRNVTRLNTETVDEVNRIANTQTQGTTTRVETSGTPQTRTNRSASGVQRTTVQGNTTQGSSREVTPLDTEIVDEVNRIANTQTQGTTARVETSGTPQTTRTIRRAPRIQRASIQRGEVQRTSDGSTSPSSSPSPDTERKEEVKQEVVETTNETTTTQTSRRVQVAHEVVSNVGRKAGKATADYLLDGVEAVFDVAGKAMEGKPLETVETAVQDTMNVGGKVIADVQGTTYTPRAGSTSKATQNNTKVSDDVKWISNESGVTLKEAQQIATEAATYGYKDKVDLASIAVIKNRTNLQGDRLYNGLGFAKKAKAERLDRDKAKERLLNNRYNDRDADEILREIYK